MIDLREYKINKINYKVNNLQSFSDEIVNECLGSIDVKDIGEGKLDFCDSFDNRIYMLITKLPSNTYLVEMYSTEE